MTNQASNLVTIRKPSLSFKSLFLSIKNNGFEHIEFLSSTVKRQLAYANLIWLTTYAGLMLYLSFTALVTTTPPILFWVGLLASNLLFISYFFIVKFGAIHFSKHWLLIITFTTVTYFDVIANGETYVYLCLFAFLPAPMNIFLWNKYKWAVVAYCLLPIFYAILSQLIDFGFLQIDPQIGASLVYQKTFNLILAFFLFATFSGYMVFNSVAKQNKLTLQRSTLQSTLDNSDAAIWSIDKDYNLTAANAIYLKSIENVFGIFGLKTGDNIRNHEVWNKMPILFREEYYSVLQGKQVLHEVDLEGDIFSIKGVPVLDNNSNVLGATFVSRNITTKKRAEETLLNAKRIAEEASNAKARFLSNMSHELRTPLNGIIGITRIMKDEKVLPSQETHFKTLQNLSEHTLQIINNILDFAKIEAGKASLDSTRFGLRRFLEKITSIFQATAKLKGIQFDVERIGDTDIYVKGDEVRLSQVLINLIGNALKFTEKGTVTLCCKTEVKGVNFADIHFSIKDTGIGIKEENLSKIFESFSQADANTTRQFGGTGLGLSIGQKIITLMGSKLHVNSKYGHGTEFYFSLLLPVSSAMDIQPLFEYQQQISNKDLSGLHILLAEDNKINQLVATRLLQKMNATVSVVSNGKEAFEFADIDKQSVILMDLDMPIMDGYESTYLIKKMYPSTPIIALTAASFDDMHNYLTKKGFDEVVQKPFVPDDLLTKIYSVLKESA